MNQVQAGAPARRFVASLRRKPRVRNDAEASLVEQAPRRETTTCLAEVDGNRTRRTEIIRSTRFEGGGAHQVPGHLRARP